MSIDRCQRCGDLVDTDDEPEAYVQIGNMRQSEEYICLCRRHREQYEDEHSELSEPDAEDSPPCDPLRGERMDSADMGEA